MHGLLREAVWRNSLCIIFMPYLQQEEHFRMPFQADFSINQSPEKVSCNSSAYCEGVFPENFLNT